jgi:hypothetical protein
MPSLPDVLRERLPVPMAGEQGRYAGGGLMDVPAASNAARDSNQAMLDAAAFAPLPFANIPADAHRYATDPESRNALNYLFTALGAVPGMAILRAAAGPTLRAPALAQALRGQAGHIAYHGSPHKFDKFDSKYIGTGEGAQVYSRGLYFAEDPKVARHYQNKPHPALGRDPRDDIEELNLLWNGAWNEGQRLTPEEAVKLFSSYPSLKDFQPGSPITKQIVKYINEGQEGFIQGRAHSRIAETLDRILPPRPQGSFYTVDIADEAIPQMLDWDKLLPTQPKIVQEAAQGAVRRAQKESDEFFGPNSLRGSYLWSDGTAKIGSPATLNEMDGAAIYNMLDNVYGKRAAATLRDFGTRGVRYLDNDSRRRGAGASNFVVFDDSDINILKRE